MESVAAFWRAQNGVRHITPRGLEWPEGEWIKSAFDDLKGKSVIEFGCGPGRLAGLFDPDSYLGVDINQNAVLAARERNSKHRFETIDTAAPIGPIDVIVCHTVLVHVPDEELAKVIARFDAKRVVVNEITGRHWRRDGEPPVFNREVHEYQTAFAFAGFTPGRCAFQTYRHYNAPMALMNFDRL